ncbi:GAF domain-containing protein [Pararhizobium arenae]|uniref:GAF domain-containing protein n=1 Tax=Pararhizobium arenae TaxID=1856850 RepID=UPI00094B2C28|nr:GAF domain-containing protein [Pararhizobium arenae]
MTDPWISNGQVVMRTGSESDRASTRRHPVVELLASTQFASSSLGPRERWDPSLETVISLMAESHFPMFVAWGDGLTFLYNDAYAEILGNKHPAAFGARFQDVWSEIWDDIYPLIEKATNGIATYSEDLPLIMNRAGYDEQSWFTFSYSPVRDRAGAVRGMFCAVTETTDRVLLQQKQSFHLALEEALKDLADPEAVMATAAEALGRALKVARVGYGEIDDEAEHVVVKGDWTDGRIASVAGMHRMNDFGPPIIKELKAGRIIFVDDVDLDARVGGMAPAFHAIGSRTVLAVPLVKSGRFRAMLFAHDPAPHRWTSGEIALATEVAERTWSAVERAKSEADKARYTERLGFLDILGKTTSSLNDADAVLSATTKMLGEYLGVSSCAYADMDDDQDGFTIRGDWAAPDAQHITGRYRLRDFGTLAVAELSAGRPLVINNNLEEIALEEAKTFRNIGIAATICIPLVKSGRLTALMAVHQKKPHYWSSHELALVKEVTDRSWAHVERVRSEAELRASQEELRRANLALEATVVEQTGELMAVEESLRHAQKMEAVGQLTGGLAHDFNNLLGGILGSLEIMQSRLAQGRISEIDRYLTAATGAAKRGASLTQRMLAFSRRQTLAPKPVDVDKLIGSMEELVRRSVGPAVDIEVMYSTSAWPVMADPGQLESAVLNLCINGRDAMAAAGKLTIAIENQAIDERAAATLRLTPGEYVSISVSDTGTGMTQDVISHAFDPFFTTKPIGEGTGLGLSMVWGFAGQSGGGVSIQSELGKGSKVSIFLPRFAGKVDAETTSLPEAVSAKTHSQRILLVDDEPLIRMVTAEELEERGYTVLEAANAWEALEILEAEHKIELLLTDVGLPNGINGRQLADLARERMPDLPILFITGYAENAVLNQGHLGPGMAVMTKPFDMASMAKRVEMLLDKNKMDSV